MLKQYFSIEDPNAPTNVSNTTPQNPPAINPDQPIVETNTPVTAGAGQTGNTALVTADTLNKPSTMTFADGGAMTLTGPNQTVLLQLGQVDELAARLGTARPEGASRARVFVMGAPGAGTLGDPADLNATKGRYRAMAAHTNTVAANEALVVSGTDRLPGPAYFGLNPGMVKTGIRSNLLGDGSVLHRMAEGLIGALGQTPEAYARRVVPLLFNPDLVDRDRLFFNNKAVPIRPSDGMDRARSGRFFDAAEDLLRTALA